jgi:hypothetical protein
MVCTIYSIFTLMATTTLWWPLWMGSRTSVVAASSKLPG